jgi:hypothetical protein
VDNIDTIISILAELGFSNPEYVIGRASIADLFRPNRRCGIYVLHFLDGWYYVGQAVDVVRRYAQHCQNHTDIEKISFKLVSRSQLNLEERNIIGELEYNRFRLRNIALVSIPHWESDFDFIMPPQEQEKWLHNLSYMNLEGNRLVYPELRTKYHKKYKRLIKKPHATEVIQVLREYVRVGIPSILKGEMSFWSCSCLPTFHNPNVTIYSRISIYWQEVFTVGVFAEQPFFSWHLALSPLEENFGSDPNRLLEKYPSLELEDHSYQPGGQDQINIRITDVSEVLNFIHDPEILPAVRLFNLRLSKKGACVYSRYHCLDLADKLVQ